MRGLCPPGSEKYNFFVEFNMKIVLLEWIRSVVFKIVSHLWTGKIGRNIFRNSRAEIKTFIYVTFCVLAYKIYIVK